MRVLLAPDGFTGTLSALEAAEAMARGWARSRPGDDIDLCPMSDGGPGFVRALAGALGGDLAPVEVTGPLGAPVTASLLLTTGTGAPRGTGTEVAYVESALACGTHLLPPGERDATAATTHGVGELMAAARRAGARRVVVGLGGSATTDAGAGMLAALGAGPPAVLSRGGRGLARVSAADLADLAAVRRQWSGIDLVAASDVDVPLLGPSGAARGFGPQKGADPAQVQELEEALAAFASAAAEALEGALEVEVRQAASLAGAPGAGAAGGLGYGLALLGARRQGGAQAVAEAVDLAGRLAAVARGGGVVLTGEGSLDWQSLRGKVVAQVASLGRQVGAAVHAVAGQVRLDAAQVTAAGLAGAHAVVERPDQLAGALADPAGTLADRVAALAAGLGG